MLPVQAEHRGVACAGKGRRAAGAAARPGSRDPLRRAVLRAAGSLARHLAGVPEGARACRAGAGRTQRGCRVWARLCGDDSTRGRAFKELGFDSLDGGRAAQPVRRLRPGCGCRLVGVRLSDRRQRWPSCCWAESEMGLVPVLRCAATASRSVDEPIAIVGMGCRYPGGVSRRRSCGSLVARGGDAISAFSDGSRLGFGELV